MPAGSGWLQTAHQRSDAGHMRCRHARAALRHVAREAGTHDRHAWSRDVYRRRAVIAEACAAVQRVRRGNRHRSRGIDACRIERRRIVICAGVASGEDVQDARCRSRVDGIFHQ